MLLDLPPPKMKQPFGGRFILVDKNGNREILPNTIPKVGQDSFLKMALRADVSEVASGGNFYIGLCDQTITAISTLAAITTEPGVVNGYSRQAIARNAFGWPTAVEYNNIKGYQSAAVSFTASGGDFDTAFTRLFLCNAASGTTGVLFSVSSSRASALTVTVALSPYQVYYELFFAG